MDPLLPEVLPAVLPPVLAGVAAQPGALHALAAAARRPVHAYVLVGAPGTGAPEAATAFAAALLCPAGGDGSCEICRRVLKAVHPDVTVVEREGAAISIDAAREVARLAARSPAEGTRKVLILNDFHLVRDAGPALLKTIEEPPASAVFVVLAEFVPPELVTIASRCVRVDFGPLTPGQVIEALTNEGVLPDRAAQLAAAAGGRLDRARLLAGDSGFDARIRAWRSLPGRLDGTGATAAALADELLGLLDAAGAPLRARQELEAAALEARNARAAEVNGKPTRSRAGGRGGSKVGVRELEERHRREQRRQRTDELRAGLAALASAYRDRLAAAAAALPARAVPDPSAEITGALAALDLIHATGASLQYNPGELLALQALLARLGRLTATGAAGSARASGRRVGPLRA